MTLKQAVNRARLTYRPLAKALGMSPAGVSRVINYGEYPIRLGREASIERLSAVLKKCGIPVQDVEFPQIGVRPGYTGANRKRITGMPVRTHFEVESHINTEAIDLMQLDRSVLQLFGLRANPFLNDVETDDDVFQNKGHEQVATAIRDAIDQRGFLAIVAPSGAGKTTIWDGIESEYGMRDDCVICKSQIKAREKLTPEHLARCLIYGLLGENTHIPREAESRGRQLSSALRAIRTGSVDKRAVLYIDDAHFCNTSVLRQLKTFFEEKIGRFRLLSVILVGLPELKQKLAEFPEIGNRIRLVEVPGVPVQDYLSFKLRRAGSSIEKLFDQGGLSAFLDRFRAPRRPAIGYPLTINTTCIRAMVKLHQNGGQPGERISREIVDSLPGEQSRRPA